MVVAPWSVTQEVAGSNPFDDKYFVTEFASVKTFRKTSNDSHPVDVLCVLRFDTKTNIGVFAFVSISLTSSEGEELSTVNILTFVRSSVTTVEEEHGILTYNGWMFSLPHFHFEFKSVNISTILTSKLKVCVYVSTSFMAIT